LDRSSVVARRRRDLPSTKCFRLSKRLLEPAETAALWRKKTLS
jgi:hypothetical protein